MRAPPRSVVPLAFAALLGVVAVLVASGTGRGSSTGIARPAPVDWRGLVGEARAQVPIGQRMIVVLTTPSVGQRLAQAHYATESQERAWWAAAYAAQKQVLLKLASLGVTVSPDFSYYRVLDGFSAVLDPRAVSLLEQMPEVAGVYPVRATFPASVSETVLSGEAFGAASGHRPLAGLPGYDGNGVTIALLDTGVDLIHPYLGGDRLLPGFDLVDHRDDASARPNPLDPTQIERHGTELAGILAGRGGPDGLHGVAPGATILPIRVAGWEPGSDGSELVYGRSDQLIAGLDRAVDPNGDGDEHDAARIALVGVVEPYAAFTDGPEAQAVQGALDLNTLVVAPAGNDGGAGPAFGSVAGPAGAPAALAVGATDSRAALTRVRVVLRRGLDVILDQALPLLGAAAPRHAMTLSVATPRSARGLSSADYFDRHGLSLVAGRAVVVPAGADPEQTVTDASRAGAAVVLLYGDQLPPGSLRLSEDQTAPAVVIPTPAAEELLAARRAGIDVGIAIGAPRAERNTGRGVVAGFSSQGLAYDSGLKPTIAAPGVAVATAEPGRAADGSALYGTVNGTSVAAATVAGAAADLAQMRPALDAASLASLLAGYAQPGRAPATAVGAGALRLGASAVGEIAALPLTLGFGIWRGPHWHATRTITIRNASTRALRLSVASAADSDDAELRFRIRPSTVFVPIGRARRVQVTVTAPIAPTVRLVTGAVQISAPGTETLRVPWALLFKQPTGALLDHAAISSTSFRPSDTDPSILTVQAGALVREGGLQIVPVRRLDILLYTASGKFIGVMARLRDLLPGAYSFGITGRGPTSVRLAPGGYELRLAAWPTLPLDARPSRAQVKFTIQ
jgi:subtilisin family serine protease